MSTIIIGEQRKVDQVLDVAYVYPSDCLWRRGIINEERPQDSGLGGWCLPARRMENL